MSKKVVYLIVAAFLILISGGAGFVLGDQHVLSSCQLVSVYPIAMYDAPGENEVGFVYPKERVRSLMDRGGWRLVVTDENLAGWLPDYAWCQ